MMVVRGSHKVDRLRVTFEPTSDEQGFQNVPSTFSPSSRTYSWRRMNKVEYLIVPKKISSNQVVVEVFVESRQGKATPGQVQEAVEKIVESKIQSEWQGLKLAGIRRAASAIPPDRRFVRGTIEEILGSNLG